MELLLWALIHFLQGKNDSRATTRTLKTQSWQKVGHSTCSKNMSSSTNLFVFFSFQKTWYLYPNNANQKEMAVCRMLHQERKIKVVEALPIGFSTNDPYKGNCTILSTGLATQVLLDIFSSHLLLPLMLVRDLRNRNWTKSCSVPLVIT